MGKKINLERYYKAVLKLDKAKTKYDRCNDEYNETVGDYRAYCDILERTSGEYIKLHAGAYMRMFHIKKDEIDDKKGVVTITGDSVEIMGGKSVFQDDVTLEFPLTTDCELLQWTYENQYGRYNASDYMSFIVKAIQCNEVINK